MKVVYCDRCEDVWIKSRLEPNTCNSCGRAARPIRYSRPWQYYASTAVLLAATAILIATPIPDLFVRVGILAVAITVAVALSSWSIRLMRVRILKRVQEAGETRR